MHSKLRNAFSSLANTRLVSPHHLQEFRALEAPLCSPDISTALAGLSLRLAAYRTPARICRLALLHHRSADTVAAAILHQRYCLDPALLTRADSSHSLQKVHCEICGVYTI
jgi:hypothetical protein